MPYVASDSVIERRLAADLVRARGEFVLSEAYAARRAPLGLPLIEVVASLMAAPAVGRAWGRGLGPTATGSRRRWTRT